MDELVSALLLTTGAGLATAVGSMVALFMRQCKEAYLSVALGFSAGVMIYISFVELLGQSIMKIGLLHANIAFFCGIVAIFLIDLAIPHHYEEERCAEVRLERIGVVLAIGIAIHNLPEGMAVVFSALSNINIGVLTAIAIALHNIPEGISISVPILAATKSRAKAFWYSALSGFAEPLGALLGLAILGSFLSEHILYSALAAAAGVMVFISFDELLPVALKGKESHLCIFGLFLGMAVMAITMVLL